jgi:hypothetical protein
MATEPTVHVAVAFHSDSSHIARPAPLPICVRQGCCSKVAAGFTHSPAMSGEKLNFL